MTDGPPLPRGRRYAVRGLLIAGTVLAVLSIAAVFANRQVLNSDNWADTSSALLEDEAIRTQIGLFLVDEVYANVDVEAELAAALPPRLQPLAGPAAGAVRSFAEQRADRFLQRPRVQQAWTEANRLTAEQFIKIAEGDSKAITQSGDAVVLDLRVVLLDLVQRLGLPGTLAGKIPEGAARLKIMSADQVETAEAGVTLLKSLAVVLPILTFLCLGLAVFLAEGRRRKTLLHAGVGLILAGLVMLVLRNVIGEQITTSLASTEAAEPAAANTWDIGSRMLRDVSQALIIGAIPLILAALLAGPSRWATSLRHLAAPYLRDRPGVVYGLAGALFALVIWWGPIPATRLLVPVIIMAILLVVGVEALRRQTAEEFPAATEEDTKAALHARFGRLRGTTAADKAASGQG